MHARRAYSTLGCAEFLKKCRDILRRPLLLMKGQLKHTNRAHVYLPAASIGGCAHLVNFSGSSTVPCLIMARNFYNCEFAGFSIPSAEHSTITSWGKSHEAEAFMNTITKFPDGAISVVSDSYNIWNACERIWGEELKSMVIKRGQRGSGPVVVRPDSGDPPTVVVKVLEILGSKFGTVSNSKGYKMLPHYIRVMQGDGVNFESLKAILEHMKIHGWSADNVAFGSGGALLQKLDKDTLKCTYRCKYLIVNGEKVHIDNSLHTKTEFGDLVTVYKNGELIKEYSLDEIRERAKLHQSEMTTREES